MGKLSDEVNRTLVQIVAVAVGITVLLCTLVGGIVWMCL